MRFIKGFFRFLWRLLDGLRKTLHLVLLLLLVGLVIAAVAPSVPSVPTKTALVVAPEGELVEQLSGDPFQRAVSETYAQSRPETLLRDVLDSIAAAKTDSRVKVLVLDLDHLGGGGMSKLEELAGAVRDFKTSGKPVIAYGLAYDQSQYYIAANADEIYLDPQGMVMIDGFGYYRMFMKDAIDKLAVDVNVFRAGKFKSYTDQFSRNDMSDQEKEESRAWLDSLWKSYQAATTHARGLPEAALRDYTEQLVPALRAKDGDLAALALERGLVTEVKSRPEVEERIKALSGEDQDSHSFQGVWTGDYVKIVHSQRMLKRAGHGGKVGVVVAAGEIIDGSQPPGTIGGDSTAELIRDAHYDDDVKAVVLRIDSPGGSVVASEVIRREIESLKAAGKPVVVSMSSVAASGGYYIAMNADEIWASPTTITGSIGVFSVFPTASRTLAKLGLQVDGIGTTPWSGAFQLERPLDEPARQFLQMTVDHEYQHFIQSVGEARGKSAEQIDAIAQGRVWAGDDALPRGLVDHLGTYQNALDAAARRAGLSKDYPIKYVEPALSWRALFAEEVNSMAARVVRAVSPRQTLSTQLRRVLTPLEAEMARWSRFTNPREAYYYCMCTVN